jgi:hypothetical protein
MPTRDLTGYWRLLRAIYPPEARPPRPPKPERATVPLVHRPTLDRAQVRGAGASDDC